MLKPILSEQELSRLKQAIDHATSIVICAHRGPDGDAVGSSLGWAEYLQGLGKRVSIIMPNPFPDFLHWMPGSHTIMSYDKRTAAADEIIQGADLIFCLDFNALDRLKDMGDAVGKSKARRIIIDHHLNPDLQMADIVISHPEMCATGELVFRLISQLGGFETMTRQAATCLYTGMMTDTGGFTYNSIDPDI